MTNSSLLTEYLNNLQALHVSIFYTILSLDPQPNIIYKIQRAPRNHPSNKWSIRDLYIDLLCKFG